MGQREPRIEGTEIALTEPRSHSAKELLDELRAPRVLRGLFVIARLPSWPVYQVGPSTKFHPSLNF